MTRKAFRGGLLAALLPLLASCTEYDHFVVQGVDAPYGGAASTATVQVPLGGIVKADVFAVSKANAVIPGFVRSSDRNILEVRLAADETQTFAFLGKSPGTVTLDFIANGGQGEKIELSVTARVFDPASP